MEIAYLNDYPGLITRLAQLQAQEWRHLYADWDAALASAEFAVQHADGRLPTTRIALRDGELLGMVSVIHDDLPGWGQLNPWLANLYVLPAHRRCGIGRALVTAAESLLVKNGIERAYLFTETRRTWFEELGWRWFADTTVLIYPAVIMVKGFSALRE